MRNAIITTEKKSLGGLNSRFKHMEGRLINSETAQVKFSLKNKEKKERK